MFLYLLYPWLSHENDRNVRFVLFTKTWNARTSIVGDSSALLIANSRFWLEVSDLDVHSVYRTVDGYIPSWSNWFDGEPSFRSKVGDEICVIRFERRYDGKWDGSKCSYPTMFYCESTYGLIQVSTINTKLPILAILASKEIYLQWGLNL